MNFLVTILLIAIFLFPDTVVLSPVLPVTRIIKSLMILILFLSYIKTKLSLNEFKKKADVQLGTNDKRPDLLLKLVSLFVASVILFGKKFHRFLNPTLRIFLTVWAVMITYIFLIDFVRNKPVQAINDFLINLSFFLMFLAFIAIELNEDFHSRKFAMLVRRLSVLIIFMGLLQVFFPRFTYENLFSHNPLINQNTNDLTTDYIFKEGRITGPFNISIGYSILLGYIIIFSLVNYEQEKKNKYLFLLISASFISVFTFTRSLIYGILPSIFIGKYLLNNHKRKLIKNLGYVAIGTIVLFILMTRVIEHKSERIKSFVDPGTVAKLIANYYGTIGALKQNPLLGIPFEQNIDVIFAGIEISDMETKESKLITDTNHNQFIWFLKYYGIAGLIIFILFNYFLLKLILSIKKFKFKTISLLFYIYFLQFSLLHNNFFFRDFYFLVFTGIALNRDKYYEN